MSDRPDSPDPLDVLRAANPSPANLPLAEFTLDRSRLLQEITMSDPTQSDPTQSDPTQSESLTSSDAGLRSFGPAPSKDELMPRRTARSGRRFAITGVAAASAVAVGFGVVALGPGSTTSAEAAVVKAAQATEASDSGTATITIGVDGLDASLDGAPDGSFVLSTAFDGTDLSARLDGDQAGNFGFGGAPEVRVVDGVIYLNIGDGSWYSVDDPNIATMLSTVGLPIDIRSDLSSGIVELVTSADNVEDLGDSRYRATVTVEEARRLADSYPSLGLYTDRMLPAEIAQQPLEIELVLDGNGLIDVVTIGATLTDPDDPSASAGGSITIDFNDLGIDQDIVAPEGAETLDLGSLLNGD